MRDTKDDINVLRSELDRHQRALREARAFTKEEAAVAAVTQAIKLAELRTETDRDEEESEELRDLFKQMEPEVEQVQHHMNGLGSSLRNLGALSAKVFALDRGAAGLMGVGKPLTGVERRGRLAPASNYALRGTPLYRKPLFQPNERMRNFQASETAVHTQLLAARERRIEAARRRIAELERSSHEPISA